MSSTTLLTIQKNLGRYGLSTMLILGNIGNFFTVIMLAKTLKKRVNSCCMYLISATISNWIIINTGLLCNLYGVGNIDPQYRSDILCKIRWYGPHVLLMLSRSFMVSACIDRWAICSSNVTIRSFSRPYIAIRVIAVLLIIWPLIPIHMLVFFTLNNSGRCGPSSDYALPYSVYVIAVVGTLPVILMSLFSSLTWYNLQLSRIRVAAVNLTTQRIQIHKRDRDLIKMLTGEVLVYCLTTFLYPINMFYGVMTRSITDKDSMRLAIESLVSYVISPILTFTYCCVQFYVYMIFCDKFRQDFLQLFQRRNNQQNIALPMGQLVHQPELNLAN